MNLRNVEIDWASTGLPPVDCPENPVDLEGAPIGMYHCPYCGCMQLAGYPHVDEPGCWLGIWPRMFRWVD